MTKAAYWAGIATRIGIGSVLLFLAVVKVIASATGASVFRYEGF